MTGPTAAQRERILGRVRKAMATGPRGEGDVSALPDRFQTPAVADPLAGFTERFRGNGGEVVAMGEMDGGWEAWLAAVVTPEDGRQPTFMSEPRCGDLVAGMVSASVPSEADVGVVQAEWAVAESGTLVLGPDGGRAVQLLPGTLVVVVPADRVVGRLSDGLDGMLRDGRLPAVVALHSGPSKSADIGRVVVTGVHGPGRVVAVLAG